MAGGRFSTLVILENVGPRPVDYLAVSFEESQPVRRNPPTLEEEYFAGTPRCGGEHARWTHTLISIGLGGSMGLRTAQSHVLSWDAAALQARLPVLPGQTISLPVTVTAKASRYPAALHALHRDTPPV